MDSGFYVEDSGFFSSGTRIRNSNPLQESGLLELTYGLQGLRFQIPQAKISRILRSGSPYMERDH